MANKKKRNKPYKGKAPAKPTVVKVSAQKRSPLHQWYIERRQIVKPVAIGAVIVVFALIVIIGLVGVFTS